MLGVYTFSPEDVTISLSGFVIKDLAPDSFVEVIPNAPSFLHVDGIRGKTTRVRQRNKSGTIILRIQQTSPVNDLLSKIVLEDEIQMTGLLEVAISDAGGSTTSLYQNCYIREVAKLSYSGSELQPREWYINYEVGSRNYVGGNKMPALDFLKVFN